MLISLLLFSTTLAETSDEGVNIAQVIAETTAAGHNKGEIKIAIEALAAEGEIYSTIDEQTFKVAE
jgi:hypothetical protein